MKILVTGGSSGLGKAIVKACAATAADQIYFTYCRHEEAARELEQTFPNVKALQVDFQSTASVDAFIEQLTGLDIDVLVNNAYAGKALGTHFHKTPAADFTQAFNDNVVPTVRITQTCLAGMRKRRSGKVINIITAYCIGQPPTGFSVYTATKAYLQQLSQSIAREYSRYGITSNCVLPDYMPTAFGAVEDFQLEQMQAAHPLKRLLQPEEVAEVVKFLTTASPQLNGAEIPIRNT